VQNVGRRNSPKKRFTTKPDTQKATPLHRPEDRSSLKSHRVGSRPARRATLEPISGDTPTATGLFSVLKTIFWNYQRRGACSKMRFLGSSFVALIVLYLIDQEFYDGRYSAVVVGGDPRHWQVNWAGVSRRMHPCLLTTLLDWL
jgi:hypothetical protein